MKRIQRCMLLLVAIASFTLPQVAALGQGTNGIFPEPLDWRAFQELMGPLHLSPEQVEALEAPHGEYLVTMMALRDGPIAEFMENASMKFARSNNSSEEISERVSEYRRIAKRMAAVEGSFLDGLSPVLSQDQVLRISIVKDWRERQRILESPWPWPQWAPSTKQLAIELRPLVQWDILDGTSRIAVENALATNEERRTRLTRQLFDQRLKGYIKEVEIEAELGPIHFPYDDEGMTMEVKGEDIQAWEDEHLRRHHEAYGTALKSASRIRATYHDGVDSIVSILPDRTGRDFQWIAWRRGYGIKDTFQVRRMVVKWIEKIERKGEDSAAFEELLSGHDSRTAHHARKLMEIADGEAGNQGGTFFFFKEETKDSPRSQVESKLQDEQVRTAREFHALLGDDAPEDLRRVIAHYDGEDLDGNAGGDRFGEPAKQTSISIVITGDASDMEDLEMEGDGASFMFFGSTESAGSTGVGGPGSGLDFLASAPDAMGRDDIELLAADLQMDEDSLDIVDVLYETYQKEAAAILHQFEMKRKESAMAMAPRKGNGPGKDIERFLSLNRDMQALQKEALEKMRSLDEQFFDDLILAVEDSDDQVVLQWHRLARQRTYAAAPTDPMSTAMAMMGGVGNSGWKIDLMREIGKITLPHEQRRAALLAMGDWHESTTDVMETLVDLQSEESEFMTSMIPSYEDPHDIDMEVAMESMKKMQDISRRRNALRDEQQQRNEIALQAVRDVLPPEVVAQVNLAWAEASYPAVYIDPRGVGDKLLAAMELEGLDEAARAELLALQLGYSGQYKEQCGALVEIFESMPPPPGMGSFNLTKMEERDKAMNQAERIRFERDDLSDKTRDRLRAMLTEEQIEMIGGLDVPKNTTMHWPKF